MQYNQSTLLQEKKRTEINPSIPPGSSPRFLSLSHLFASCNLFFSFSKRRNGLVKKASELSLLCGVEVALITISPGQKVFAFGHPDVDTVLDRYLKEEDNPDTNSHSHSHIHTTDNINKLLLPSNTQAPAAAASNHLIQKLKNECEELMKRRDEEKRRAAEVEVEVSQKSNIANNRRRFWWDDPFDNMGLEELQDYKKALQQLRQTVACRINQLIISGNDHNSPTSLHDDAGAANAPLLFQGSASSSPQYGVVGNDMVATASGSGVGILHQGFGNNGGYFFV